MVPPHNQGFLASVVSSVNQVAPQMKGLQPLMRATEAARTAGALALATMPAVKSFESLQTVAPTVRDFAERKDILHVPLMSNH